MVMMMSYLKDKGFHCSPMQVYSDVYEHEMLSLSSDCRESLFSARVCRRPHNLTRTFTLL